MTPTIFFSAGEPSGDIHAGELIAELRRHVPDMAFRGFGGPNMASAGCVLDIHTTALAVMGFSRVVRNLPTFRKWLNRAKDIFAKERPDAVVLVDFPGFNWHVARAAKAAGIPVYYFMPPQLWAWARWRVKKMKRDVDHVLCCLDFERKWFEQNNCDVQLIGHPFLEETRKRRYDEAFLDSFVAQSGGNPILTVLPGSRDQEVAGNLSDLLDAVTLVRKRMPELRPVVAAFKVSQADTIRKVLERRGLVLPVFTGRTPELMRAATCCLAVSGSVSMELLALTKPTVIYYRVARFPLFLSRFFRRVKYITLTNLVAVDRLEGESIFYDDSCRFIPKRLNEHEASLAVFPEFLAWRNESQAVADQLCDWLANPERLERRVERLREILAATDVGDPIVNAARYIESTLRNETPETNVPNEQKDNADV